MAILTSKRESEPCDGQCLTSCLSTNHKASAEEKKIGMLCRTTVQRETRSLRTRSVHSAVVSSVCPSTARAQNRRNRDEREKQQKKKETMEEDRRGASRRHLRPRQLSLHVRRANKVTTVTKFSEERASCIRSVIPLKPRTGIASKQGTRPSNSYKSRCHSQSRAQETSNKHLSLHHNHQLPHSRHLPQYYSKPVTFSILQNSGKNSCRTSAQISLINHSVTRQLSEQPGVLRLSRRRRGLPPDSSPSLLNGVPLDRKPSNVKILQDKDGYVSLASDCHVYEIPQNENSVGDEDVSLMAKNTESHHIKPVEERCAHGGQVGPERGVFLEDLCDTLNREKSAECAQEPEKESFTNVITSRDLMPVSEVVWKHLRDKSLQGNTAIQKPVSRANDSRPTAAARTSVTKAAINSVTSAPPAHYSARHRARGTNKGKQMKKSPSPALPHSAHQSKGATKRSSVGSTEDVTEDPALTISYCSTPKDSAKGLPQTKCTTSAIKTRFSPRILLKH